MASNTLHITNRFAVIVCLIVIACVCAPRINAETPPIELPYSLDPPAFYGNEIVIEGEVAVEANRSQEKKEKVEPVTELEAAAIARDIKDIRKSIGSAWNMPVWNKQVSWETGTHAEAPITPSGWAPLVPTPPMFDETPATTNAPFTIIASPEFETGPPQRIELTLPQQIIPRQAFPSQEARKFVAAVKKLAQKERHVSQAILPRPMPPTYKPSHPPELPAIITDRPASVRLLPQMNEPQSWRPHFQQRYPARIAAATRNRVSSSQELSRQIHVLRDSASSIEHSAGKLEELELYHQADELRASARKLWLDARRLSETAE